MQHKTAFTHLPELGAILAAHSFALQRTSGCTDPPTTILGLLHGVLASAIEVSNSSGLQRARLGMSAHKSSTPLCSKAGCVHPALANTRILRGLLAIAIDICMSSALMRRQSCAYQTCCTVCAAPDKQAMHEIKESACWLHSCADCASVTPLMLTACDDRAELCAVVQVPTGGESASPADQALYDAVARALLGERADAQAPGLGAQLLPLEQLPRMLHYLLGTQLRRHLERWADMHDSDKHGHVELICIRVLAHMH